MDNDEKFAFAVIGTVVVLIFGGLFTAVTIGNNQDDEVAKQCISHGMVWHDQTNDCTKG